MSAIALPGDEIGAGSEARASDEARAGASTDARHVAGGCRDAELRQIFDAHQHRVYTLALRFSGDPDAAQDITQAVFLKIYERLHQFRGQARISTWLYRVVYNACIDHRRRQRARPLMLVPAEPIEAESPEDRLGRAQLQHAVHAAISGLEPEQRMPMLLKYLEGMSYREIADALGWPVGTVASRMNRGHQALARKLKHLRRSR